jgi:hypothetical protein
MKTYKEWAKSFVTNSEIGFDEQGVDGKYTEYKLDQLPNVLENPRLVRRFNQFCKWAKAGDYVIVGTGPTTQFNMKLIGRVVGEYEFDVNHLLYRHYRKIEIMKVFAEPILIEKWGQVQRIELVDDNDFIDTLVKSL